MMYDLFADFYVKSGDSLPRYSVLLGSFYPKTLGEMQEHGFIKDPDSIPGYVDYMKEVWEDELQNWVQEGFTCELKDVLNANRFYYRILLKAMEVEVVDDNGNYPPRGVSIGKTFVRFEHSDPDSPVFFEDMTPGPHGGNGLWFRTPMKRIKRLFKVMTMVEVITKMRELADGNTWSFNQLRRYFASGVDEALELATKVFAGQTDLNGNPAILHSLAVGLAGKTSDEKIVGFLHDILEDSDLEAEDLICAGFSDEVIRAVLILTHEKWRDSYSEYINKVIHSGNRLAINVKLNDLRHNIECGGKGRHTDLQ